MSTEIYTPKAHTKTGDTDDLAHRVNQGTSALQSGDLSQALEIFEQVVIAYPDRPEGHNNLGALYTSLGDLDRAEAAFTRVLEIMPNNPNVLYNRGIVRSQLEKFDSARIDFKSVLAVTPEDADTHNNLGVASFMQGHLPSAAKHFRKALKLKPNYPNALLNLCDVEIASDRPGAAITLCETFLATYTSVDVRRKQLELLSQNCRQALTQASRAAETLLHNDGDDPETRQELNRLSRASAVLSDCPPI